MRTLLCIYLFLSISPCTAEPVNHIFYYHGQIVEDQGPHAKSDQFGAYQYYQIVKTLKDNGFTVHAEVRKKNTDVTTYAHTQARMLKRKIADGIVPGRITLVGASKGARIVIAIQNELQNKAIKSVLLAGMFSSVVNDANTQLYGSVLSIYDKSDPWLVEPKALLKRSKSIQKFTEIVVDKNLKHGLLFRPYDDWVIPTTEFANPELKAVKTPS